ncbi:MAG: NAD(P)/FAD-dependent oxidoreductase [Candidatus Nanopelagicales bacterium]
MTQVVVVGAGLGGLRAAESLRGQGFDVMVIGDEPHLPYNRPPLSKESLKGGVEVEGLHFRRKHDDIDWRLGAAATGCSLTSRTVSVDDSAYTFDGLVIASGIRPRHLPVPGPQPQVLRTADDALALRSRLTPGTSLLVVGAGFIGCEVAATARQLGCEVTVTAYDAEPMMRPLGAQLGAAMKAHHEAHGVTFHLGQGVSEFHADGVTLADGTRLAADVVIEAVGSVPNVEWLAGNDLDLQDGVLTDNLMRVVGTDVPVVAVGDIARFPNPRFDDVPRRIEHWNLPTETGKRAGQTLGALLNGEEPTGDFRPMPAFWSDQYDIGLQSYGLPGIGEATLVDGEWSGDCIVEYLRDGEVVGVVGVNRTKDLMDYRKSIGAS